MSTNRFSMIVAGIAISILAILTLSSVVSSGQPAVSGAYDQIELDRSARYQGAAAQQAYLDWRHGEWMAGPIAKAAYADRAYLAHREGEWMAGPVVSAADADRAYLLYREGEWMAGPVVSAADAGRAYLLYREGEWFGK